MRCGIRIAAGICLIVLAMFLCAWGGADMSIGLLALGLEGVGLLDLSFTACHMLERAGLV